jgi:shikimate kinase
MPETMPHTLRSIAGPPKRIVLLGFMGAGKSTVGPLLAVRLGWTFYDADSVIEERAGLSVPEVFRLHGEAAFREMEAETIADLLKLEQSVIALGGGAVEHPPTRALFSSQAGTYTVFLDAQLETMIDRCNLSTGVRPLLQNLDALPERYHRRLPLYQEATITVSTEGLSPDAVADAVFLRLKEAEPVADAMGREKGRAL